ncbi:MAG: hypothetical protein KUG79_09070 [Pseudomonadales bacterium]|nr:hypothetical protein [Pseudomonadales bacterium]
MKPKGKSLIYTPEFRASAVKLAIKIDQPKAAAAREPDTQWHSLRQNVFQRFARSL